MCLEHLSRQTIASDLEVIVVSDGPDTDAERVVNEYNVLRTTYNVLFVSIPKSQQGSARNEGVKHATADRVLFIGDDIFLEPDACEQHLLPAIRYPLSAILGFTTWDPAVGITPVMTWLEKSGWQFGYPKIRKYAGTLLPKNIQHLFTYTSQISLPTDIAKVIPFRDDMHMYGWEDIEWGMRLAGAGVRLLYEPHAKALHHHRITMEDSLKRMETLGKSAKELAKKIENFDRLPKGWKLLAQKIHALFPTMGGRHRNAFLKLLED